MKKIYSVLASDEGRDPTLSNYYIMYICVSEKDAIKYATEVYESGVVADVIIQLLEGDGNVFEPKEVCYEANGKRIK